MYAPTALVALGWAVSANFVRLWVPPAAVDEPAYASSGWQYVHWGSRSESTYANFEHPPLAKLLFGLAELTVGHASITAARAVCAGCTVASGIVLACWLSRAAGRWTGLLAGAMVALLPMSVSPQITSFGRSAFLDPVAELFMVCSLAIAWAWWHSAGRRSWWLALATGAVTGMAAASKENGFLGAVGVVALAIGWAGRGERAIRLAQAGLAAVTAVVTFGACYLPLGDPLGHAVFLIRYQWNQSERGHLVGYAGRITAHPTWWSNLWFAWHSLGPWLGSVLLGTAAVAVAVRCDRAVAWCVAALVGPFVFHCLVAGNALPFYWVMWMPALLALSALGTREIALAVRSLSPRRWRLPFAATFGCILACLLLAAFTETRRVASGPLVGAGAVARIRTTMHLHGEILTAGTYAAELQPYLAESTILTSVPDEPSLVDTVVVGEPRCRTLVDPGVRALVQANLAAGTLREIHSDRLLRVYVASGRLRLPAAAEVAAQAPGKLAEHC